jgi:CheY-like chemotaxis protein
MNNQPILLVEDDENDILLMQFAMKRAGTTNPLYVVRDGQEAIEYLEGAGEFVDRTQFPFPSLVLLDLKLPRKSGLEVLSWIRQEGGLHALPVIVLTSSTLDRDFEEAHRLGANSCLSKPSTPEQQVELVKRLDANWFSRADPSTGPTN